MIIKNFCCVAEMLLDSRSQELMATLFTILKTNALARLKLSKQRQEGPIFNSKLSASITYGATWTMSWHF